VQQAIFLYDHLVGKSQGKREVKGNGRGSDENIKKQNIRTKSNSKSEL
jgi:hypothetical protein